MQYKITKPVRLIELFAGYGSTAMALDRLGVNYKHWRISEWETNVVRSYHAIHMPDNKTNYSEKFSKEELVDKLYKLGISNDGKSPLTKDKIARKGEQWLRDTFNDFIATRNVGSITNLHPKHLGLGDEKEETTLLTYSFPCQDLSLAGKQLGMDENSETRSALLWQVARILREAKEENCLPTVLCMENVSAIHNKKNMPNFQKWLNVLEGLGYSTYWQDLNAKDFGVAQNRLRTFAISILGDYEYTFPEPIPLKKRLKDYLENNVDEKYYISSEKADKLVGNLIDRGVLPRERERESKQGIDLTINNPAEREIANCVAARTDRGISNRKAEGTGVIEESGG